MAFLIGVGAPVFAMTSVFRETFALCAAALGVTSTAVALATSSKIGRSTVASAALGMASWTLAQTVPLPCAWVRAIAPESARAAERAARLTGEAAICTISRAPGATVEAACMALVLAAVAAASALLIARGQRRDVLKAVAASATLLSAVALGHLALASPAIYGFYRSVYAHPLLPSPLVNANHLALVATLGAMLAVLFIMEASTLQSRVGWGLAAAVCIAAGILSLSRSGIVTSVAGPLVVAAVLRRRTGSGARQRRAGGMWAVATIAATVVAVGAALAESVWSEFAVGGLTKLTLAWRAAGVVAETPWVGVGRGAFASAFGPSASTGERFLHPENFLVQWAAEWGLPVTLALGAVLSRALSKAAREARGAARLASLVCVGAIALHELADFATEMLGPAVLAMCVLVAAVEPEGAIPEGATPRWRRWLGARALAVGSGAGALAAAVTLAVAVPPRPSTFEADAVEAASRGAAELAPRLAAATRAYPAEPSVAVLGATWAVRSDAPRAGAWLNAAMELAPAWHTPHLLAAEWLLRRGREGQALLELRESAARGPQATARLACAWVERGAGVERALRATPADDGAAVSYLDALAACLSGRRADAAAVDAALLTRRPDHPQATRRAVRRALRDGRLEVAVPLLERSATASPEARIELVDALLDAGEVREASRALAPIRAERSPRVIEREATIAAREGDVERMRALFDELREKSGDSTDSVLAALLFIGRTESSIGRDERALAAFAEAHRLTGSVDALTAVARTAERLGDRPRALHAYTTLCSDGVEHGCRQAARLRQAGHGLR